jgi:hypothetical protein
VTKPTSVAIAWESAQAHGEASIDAFVEALGFWGRQAAEGRCSAPEAFISEDQRGGILIVKGQPDGLREILESEESRALMARARLVVQGLRPAS